LSETCPFQNAQGDAGSVADGAYDCYGLVFGIVLAFSGNSAKGMSMAPSI